MSEYPHNHHHGGPFHHRRDDDEEERRPPPPPQDYGYGREEGYGHPPPPRQDQHGYGGEEGYGRPPPPRSDQYGYGGEEGYGRPPPPRSDGYPPVQHVSHVSQYTSPHPHGSSSDDGPFATLFRQPTVRIYCKGNEDVCLAIRNNTVVLVTKNEDDLTQHWIKDLKYSTKVKDEEQYPAFSLVNKATKQALKHSLGQSHPVLLADYNPEKLEESVLWTQSRDVGEDYRCIRMVNNIYLNFDAFHGDKKHGGVRDGTTVVLWKWTEGDNQRWKISSWCK